MSSVFDDVSTKRDRDREGEGSGYILCEREVDVGKRCRRWYHIAMLLMVVHSY